MARYDLPEEPAPLSQVPVVQQHIVIAHRPLRAAHSDPANDRANTVGHVQKFAGTPAPFLQFAPANRPSLRFVDEDDVVFLRQAVKAPRRLDIDVPEVLPNGLGQWPVGSDPAVQQAPPGRVSPEGLPLLGGLRPRSLLGRSVAPLRFGRPRTGQRSNRNGPQSSAPRAVPIALRVRLRRTGGPRWTRTSHLRLIRAAL